MNKLGGGLLWNEHSLKTGHSPAKI